MGNERTVQNLSRTAAFLAWIELGVADSVVIPQEKIPKEDTRVLKRMKHIR
jgi:hypothetical protein